MSPKKIPVVFFGSGPVAAASLAGIKDFLDIELVITKSRPAHHKEPAPVEILARESNLRLVFANNKEEVDRALKTTSVLHSQIGVIIDFGVIVSDYAINQFDKGIINSHFSLLPRWRGADPITYCLLEGDSETGVSLMKIVPKLDDGPLIAQQKLKLPEKINSIELTEQLIALSNSMLKKYLPKYLNGETQLKPQSNTGISYSHKVFKRDSIINWHKPAKKLEQEIRAYSGWPKSRTQLNKIDCIITSADVVLAKGTPGDYQIDDNSLIIFTSDKALSIKRLKPAGKKEMSVEEFLRGYKNKL